MRRKTVSTVLSSVALAGLMLMGGCSTQKTSTSSSRSASAGTSSSTSAGATTKQTSNTQQTPLAIPRGGSMAWTTMAYPTGNPNTSTLKVTKGMPKEVRLNQPFEYEIKVENLTQLDLTDVVLIETPHDGLRVSSSSQMGQSGPDGSIIYNIGDLSPEETQTFRATGVASRRGIAGTCTEVTHTPQMCASTEVVEPMLEIVKMAPERVLKCDDMTIQYEVTNSGTGTLTGVRINHPLCDGLLTIDGQRTASFDVGTLASGQSKKFSIDVNPQRTGFCDLQATATADGGLSVQSKPLRTVIHQPVLQISKECAERQYVGRPLEVRITVKNVGDGEARNVVIEDMLPSGAEFMNASDRGSVARGRTVWNIGDLAPKASKTVTARINPIAAGNFSSAATVRGECATAVSDSCGTAVTGIPAILLEVIDLDDPIQVGGNETYLITVTNQGSAPDTNIRLTCTLEDEWQYVSASGATRGTARGQVVTFEPLPSLAAKQKATFRVVAKAAAAGNTRFKVVMISDQFQRPVEETEATYLYE